MLKALYDYAMRKNLVLPPGYINKTVKAYILLYEDGTFQDIEMGSEESVPAPDIGSLANGKDKCNILLEKRSVVIPSESTAKSRFFLSALREGAQAEPMLALCAAALEDPETAAAIRSALDSRKIKDSERISFKVGHRSILSSERVLAWWQDYRQQFLKSTGAKQPCLVTGALTVPMATTPVIDGLQSVGGHARGDALICFDKAAFRSYGLKQAANAPVSEEAFAAVKAALDALLKRAPTLAGMKFVHWYDRDIPNWEDPLMQSGDFDFSDIISTDDVLDSTTAEAETIDARQKELAAVRQADAMIASVRRGTLAFLPENASYYILLLTGVNSRIMIRRYERGTYHELKEKLELWQDDLALVSADGIGRLKPCKLTARLLRLMKYQKSDANPFARLAKELSGITPAIMEAILSGGPLPNAVAARALNFIRSEMLSGDEDDANALFGRDAAVWQWLKVWLLRNNGKRGNIMEAYNPNYISATNAYHCGALMALYEAIQKCASPDVNVTVAQRFYAAAIQTPAMVLGRLSQMSIHHLEKINNDWLANQWREKLAETGARICGSIPTTLNLEGQSEFALGYYQMSAELIREKKERRINSAEKATDKED